MGARTNFELKDEQGSVWLYSHWGGDTKFIDLANALQKAEPRWADTSYAMRIVVSQLIGDAWDSETGFGLSSFERNEEQYQPVTIDFENQLVVTESWRMGFQDFIDSQLD